MRTSQNGINLIKQFEGCRLTSYQDGGGVWTIGYGSTGNVGPGLVWTQEQADQALSEDLLHTETGINCMVTVPLTQNQFDALVSFVFNIGKGNFKDSTCLARLNAGLYLDAANWILPWHRIGSIENEGLLRRRTAERELFLKV